MTYTNIIDARVASGAPLSTSLMTQLRDNSAWTYGAVDLAGTAELDYSLGWFFADDQVTSDKVLSFTNLPAGAAHWAYRVIIGPGAGANLAAVAAGPTLAMNSVDNQMLGAQMSPDGLYMLSVGAQNDAVYEWTGTVAFDVSTFTYTTTSFSVSGQMASMRELLMKPDGTGFIILENTGEFHEYSMSTAFDLSTASYTSRTFTPAQISTAAFGAFFGDSGSKFYASDGGTGTRGKVYEYDLGTPYQLNTVTYSGNSLDVSAQTTVGGFTYGGMMRNNGLALVLTSGDSAFVNPTSWQYALSTAFDLSTATYSGLENTSINGGDANDGISFIAGSDTFYAMISGGEVLRTYRMFELPSISLPSSVKNAVNAVDGLGTYFLNFYTVDGGVNVYASNG